MKNKKTVGIILGVLALLAASALIYLGNRPLKISSAKKVSNNVSMKIVLGFSSQDYTAPVNYDYDKIEHIDNGIILNIAVRSSQLRMIAIYNDERAYLTFNADGTQSDVVITGS